MEVRAVMVNKVPLFAYKGNPAWNDRSAKIIGASYEAQSEVWYHPAYYPFGQMVKNELDMVFKGNVTYDSSVLQHLEMLAKIEDLIKKRKFKKGFTFKTTPMDHQLDGLIRAIHYHRLGLFWDCGVGKTKVSIDLIRYLKVNTLYMCPSRLVRNVQDEIAIHAFPGEIEVIAITDRLSAQKKAAEIKRAATAPSIGVPRVLIVGYETASYADEKMSYLDLLQHVQYELFICDESHKLRALDSNTSTVCSKLASKSVRRIIMTGTPSLGNPLHLYVQMRILLPWRFGNYYKFKGQHVITAKHDKNIVVGYKNLHLIREMVDEFSIQKTKEECLDLPERQVILKKICMTSKQEEMYDEIRSGLHETVNYNPLAVLKIMKLHQLCGGTLVHSPIDNTVCEDCPEIMYCVDKKISAFSAKCIRRDERVVENIFLEDNPKLNHLEDTIDGLVVGEQKKVILWYMYQNEHKIITQMLRKNKIHFVDYSVCGHEGVHEFQNSEKPMVFLSQIQSSSGITLTAATYTVYYSMSFNLEHYLQSRDRMYRKGQTKKTTEIHLIMENGLDELVHSYLEQKIDVNDALLRQDLTKQIVTKIMLKRGQIDLTNDESINDRTK